jgi:hypothetical protein
MFSTRVGQDLTGGIPIKGGETSEAGFLHHTREFAGGSTLEIIAEHVFIEGAAWT